MFIGAEIPPMSPFGQGIYSRVKGSQRHTTIQQHSRG